MLPYVRLLQYAAHEIVFRTAHVQAFVVQFQAIVFLYESLVTKPILAEVSTLSNYLYCSIRLFTVSSFTNYRIFFPYREEETYERLRLH